MENINYAIQFKFKSFQLKNKDKKYVNKTLTVFFNQSKHYKKY